MAQSTKKTTKKVVNKIGKEENKEKPVEIRKSNNNLSKFITMFVFISSIAYLTYCIINTESIINNLNNISIPIFIFLMSLVLFLFGINSNNKSKVYGILSIILLLFISFNFLINEKILKLPEEERLISYTNVSYNQLKDWADINDIELVMEYEYSDEIAKGNIIRLDVNEGTFVKEIKKIKVTISDGPDYDKKVIVPSMLGWNIDDAVEFINKNHMTNVQINYEKSDSERDIIYKQSLNGEIRRNEILNLTVSFGEGVLPDTIEMINLVDKNWFDASLWLKRNNIDYIVNYEFSEKDKNIVINQDIKEGKEINLNTEKLAVTLSKGKAIKMIDLTKMSSNEIIDWIVKNNLKVEFEEIYDSDIETGKVIKQSINVNEQVSEGTLISVSISRGQIKMQKFNNLFEFKEWANKYNINYSESYEYSSVPKGQVISYSYNENDVVDPDAVIYIRVSLGQAISIPSFIGKTKNDAQVTCNNIGIRCSFVIGSYTNYDSNVIYTQSRSVGTKVAEGSTITLTLSKGRPKEFELSIAQNELSVGNATATINNLRKVLANRYPGVNFNIIAKPHNTYSPGIPHPDSPTKVGSKIKQGNTYTIYIVAN